MMTVCQINLPVTTRQSAAEAHKYLMTQLAELFGGVTRLEGCGAWVDDHGKTIIEPVYVYQFAVSDLDRPKINLIKNIAKYAGRLTAEQAMYVQVGHQATIIPESQYND